MAEVFILTARIEKKVVGVLSKTSEHTHPKSFRRTNKANVLLRSQLSFGLVSFSRYALKNLNLKAAVIDN